METAHRRLLYHPARVSIRFLDFSHYLIPPRGCTLSGNGAVRPGLNGFKPIICSTIRIEDLQRVRVFFATGGSFDLPGDCTDLRGCGVFDAAVLALQWGDGSVKLIFREPGSQCYRLGQIIHFIVSRCLTPDDRGVRASPGNDFVLAGSIQNHLLCRKPSVV